MENNSTKWDFLKVSQVQNKQQRDERCEREMKRLRQQEKCLTCESLAPQYACLKPIMAFVCTRCSGIYREFNLGRCKSVSASIFTPEEVESFHLEGGNEKARRKFLKHFDYRELANAVSDEARLRTFIKRAFVDRVWMAKEGEEEDDDIKGGSDAQNRDLKGSIVPAAVPERVQSPDLFQGLFSSNNSSEQQEREHQQERRQPAWSSFNSPLHFSPPEQTQNQHHHQQQPVTKTITSFFDAVEQVTTGGSGFNQTFSLKPPPKAATNIIQHQHQQETKHEKLEDKVVAGKINGSMLDDDAFWVQNQPEQA